MFNTPYVKHGSEMGNATAEFAFPTPGHKPHVNVRLHSGVGLVTKGLGKC